MNGLYLAISLFVLSQSGVFIRYAQADAAAIGFWRMAIALPVLLLFFLGMRKGSALRGLPAKQWATLALCGFFLFTHWWTWFLAVQKTTLANSMVLFALNPLFTGVGAWLVFGERVERRHWIAMGFCFFGVAALFRNSLVLEPAHLVGDILGFVCALLFSAYVLVGKGLRRQMENIPFTLATYSFCTIYFVCLMLVRGLPFGGYDTTTWGAFAALAFGSTLLGHALFTYSLQHFNVNLMSILTLTEPLFTSVSAYFLFAEPLTPGLLVGFVLVACGVASLYLPLVPGIGKKLGRA